MPMCEEAHINIKEMWDVVSAARHWLHLWHDCRVVCVTDNTTVQVCKWRCVNRQIMNWVKELF